MLRDAHNRFRPLSFADILDETVEIYKSNFAMLVGIAAFLYVPYTLVTAAMQPPQMAFTKPNYTPQFADFLPLIVFGGVAMLVYLIGTPIVTGALTFGISERYLGRPAGIGDSYRRVLSASVILRLLAASLLVGLITIAAVAIPCVLLGVGIGLIFAGHSMTPIGVLMALAALPAFIVPAYVGLRLTLVTPAIIIESRDPGGAISRSWGLMQGSMLKALGVLVLAGMAVSIIQSILVAPFSVSAGLGAAMNNTGPSTVMLVMSTIVQAISSTVLMPITSIVVILFYYDQRIRKEGFDLEMLAWDLDANARQYQEQGYSTLPQEQIPPTQPQYPEEQGPYQGGPQE